MGRKTSKPTEIEQLDAHIDDEQLAAGASAMSVLGRQSQQVSDQLGYELPYERERVFQEAQFFMTQSAEAMLEAGQRVILMKENEPHGTFLEMLDRLGLHERTAQKIMQATAKFWSPKLKSNAKAISHLGKTKLYELMLEDDDELIALTQGGTIAGLTLDEIDRMTSRELKEALREERAEHRATAEVLNETTSKYNKLKTKQARIAPPNEDDIAAQLRSETGAHALTAESYIRGSVRAGCVALQEHALENETNHDEVMAGIFAQLERAIVEVRSELGIKAIADGNPLPEWARDASVPLAEQ